MEIAYRLVAINFIPAVAVCSGIGAGRLQGRERLV